MFKFFEKELAKPSLQIMAGAVGISSAFVFTTMSTIIANHFDEVINLEYGEVLDLTPNENLIMYGSMIAYAATLLPLAIKVGYDALNYKSDEIDEDDIIINRLLNN